MIFPTVSNRLSAVVFQLDKKGMQLSVFLLVGQLASAMPFEQVVRNLPRDVAHIALDETSGQYLAYKPDGSLAGKYPADTKRGFLGRKRDAGSPCAKLAVEEAKQRTCFQ